MNGHLRDNELVSHEAAVANVQEAELSFVNAQHRHVRYRSDAQVAESVRLICCAGCQVDIFTTS